jgi:NADH-quinone oxidoreductase subunit L
LFIENAFLIPILPLAGAMVVGVLGRPVLLARSHWPIITGVALALACSVGLFNEVRIMGHDNAARFTKTYTQYQWFAGGNGNWFEINFTIDPLTAIMLVTVCTVALLVVIYSRDYMRHDGHPEKGYERYFAFLGLFVFSMCALVLAGNFLLLYLGWEAVGLCSYLLIGFYYAKPEAAAAAKKAFLVNRIGDFGFGLGILAIYLWIQPLVSPGQSSLDYDVVFSHVRDLQEWQITTIALLLFCGAVGKSAQLPLYVWLPDAMEGPSPVSALIHAATMVTAGIYMVARCGAIFANSQTAMMIVAAVGAVTALFAATMALAQYDMKRILAYSTISQLGYMFLGLGVFAADSAIFHLMTHAFFKALLFLGAGSVMHAMGGIIDVRQFSGLRRVLPWTYRTFVIGSLALAGFPLLAGFWSKDEIIHAAFAAHPILGAIGMLTALLTAFYTFRMVFLAFHGEQRIPQGVHAHESGIRMLIPLGVLSVGAIFAGYLGVTFHPGSGAFLGLLQPHGGFHHFLAPSVQSFILTMETPHGEAAGHEGGAALMYLSAAIAIAGIALAYLLYAGQRVLAGQIAANLAGPRELLYHKYYVDELYQAAIVEPLRSIGRFCFAIDRFGIDGAVWFATAVPRGVGFLLRGLQRGAVQGYGLSMACGLVLLILLMLWNNG